MAKGFKDEALSPLTYMHICIFYGKITQCRPPSPVVHLKQWNMSQELQWLHFCY